MSLEPIQPPPERTKQHRRWNTLDEYERRANQLYANKRPMLDWIIAITIFTLLAAAIFTPNSEASWRSTKATWYGPGFYGNKTACGQHYTSRLPGVAANTLPCGTVVTLRRGTRTVRVPVIDTGGFTHMFDLSAWTAKKLCGCNRPYTMTIKWRITH